jgi:hypothetical protein
METFGQLGKLKEEPVARGHFKSAPRGKGGLAASG